MRYLLPLLLALCASTAAQAFDLDLGAIKWSGMARYFVIDYPETATLQLKPFPVPGRERVPARIVLSQYRGLFYFVRRPLKPSWLNLIKTLQS